MNRKATQSGHDVESLLKLPWCDEVPSERQARQQTARSNDERHHSDCVDFKDLNGSPYLFGIRCQREYSAADQRRIRDQ